MTTCIRCHRPLKRPTESGMGSTCAKKVKAIPEHDCDLFGYELDKAVESAHERVKRHIAATTAEAHIALRRQFREARVRAGVWSK